MATALCLWGLLLSFAGTAGGLGSGLSSVSGPGSSTRTTALPGAGRRPTHSLVINGDSLLCGTGQVRLTAVASGGMPTSYTWSTGATTASINVAQPGIYRVTVTYDGFSDQTAQHRVRVLVPVVSITGGGRLCPGGSVALLAAAPRAASLRWNTGATTAAIAATQPGTYTVTATYGTGCAATAQVVVVANSLVINGPTQLCPGQSAVLTAAGQGVAVAGYRWNTGATTPTLRVGQAGTYTVVATLVDGCVLTDRHVVGPPKATVAAVAGDTLLCPGTTLQLTAQNPDALTYRWSTGATTAAIAVTQPGTYAVELTYGGGCTSRDSLRMRATPAVAPFTLGADTILCFEQPLMLRAPVASGAGVSFRWSDGSRGPMLRAEEPGLYSLQVVSRCNSRTVFRRVDYVSCLFIPNVITPNADGRNDQFVVKGLTRGAWALTLYNRWGRQVYATDAYGHDWGTGAAPGVYHYLLQQGATRYKGLVEVVR